MFKKIKMPRSKKRRLRQRGQVVLLYALLVPALFFFVGVTFDLSWYYLNVARMQNAADAAVLAGAQKLIEREESLSDYNYTSFVNGYNGKTASESSRGTFRGDSIAKTYVGKNLAVKGSTWEDDTILDLFTKKDLRFTSSLMGDTGNNFEVLYYHVMLEEDVPHMFLKGWFSNMNAKVSSVAKITQFMKGYDFFQQMKHLESKNTYAFFDELLNKKGSKEAAIERSVLLAASDTLENYHFNESATFPSDENYLFENLFIGSESSTTASKSAGNIVDFYRTYREINIDTVYRVRDYAFYVGNYGAFDKIREENPDYEELSDDELAWMLSKDTYDPLYVRIESETDSARQTIINVNVANMNELSDRPIILFYDGPLYDESLPVILNLNADFRGVLYAPNSPVVINGNAHKFQGFIIAESYVELETDNGNNFYHEIKEEYTDDYGDTQYNIVMLIDGNGEVQYKKNPDGSYQAASDFKLAESNYDSFNLIWFENYSVSTSPLMTDNLFTTANATLIK